jgi:hypothetical protein
LWVGANPTEQVTISDVFARCKVTSLRQLDSAACLPDDPTQRLQALYDVFQFWLHHRVFYNESLAVLGQACPYIFTYDVRLGRWQHDTTILYYLVGSRAEAVQEHPLKRFDGRLLLREIEPETSYVDWVAVRLITADGREIILKSTLQSLSNDDSRYLILHQGDEHLLWFDVPPSALPARQASVIAAGYYVPKLLDETR